MMSQNTLSVKTGIHSIMVDVMKYRLLFSTILYRDLIVYYSKQSFVCMFVTKLELGNADSPEAPASILKLKLINISENWYPFYYG